MKGNELPAMDLVYAHYSSFLLLLFLIKKTFSHTKGVAQASPPKYAPFRFHKRDEAPDIPNFLYY